MSSPSIIPKQCQPTKYLQKYENKNTLDIIEFILWFRIRKLLDIRYPQLKFGF